MSISPQGYTLGGDPQNVNPFWGEDEQTTWTIEAEATVDNTSGSPSVNVETETDTTTKTKTFAFAFSGLKGEKGNTGASGTNGQGVPTGGTAGQVLTKIDGTDFNTQWTTPQSSSSYDGNYNVNYTTDSGTFFSGLYNRQIIPVQAYLYTNASTGNFVLYNRYKASDNTSASGEQTPIAIRCKINFDLGQPDVGGGVVSGDGIIWYAVSGENDFKRKYNGKIEMNIGENAIDLRLSGGEFIFYDNDNPNFYYITTQGQRWGSYGPTITFANMSIFRGVYLKAQS